MQQLIYDNLPLDLKIIINTEIAHTASTIFWAFPDIGLLVNHWQKNLVPLLWTTHTGSGNRYPNAFQGMVEFKNITTAKYEGTPHSTSYLILKPIIDYFNKFSEFQDNMPSDLLSYFGDNYSLFKNRIIRMLDDFPITITQSIPDKNVNYKKAPTKAEAALVGNTMPRIFTITSLTDKPETTPTLYKYSFNLPIDVVSFHINPLYFQSSSNIPPEGTVVKPNQIKYNKDTFTSVLMNQNIKSPYPIKTYDRFFFFDHTVKQLNDLTTRYPQILYQQPKDAAQDLLKLILKSSMGVSQTTATFDYYHILGNCTKGEILFNTFTDHVKDTYNITPAFHQEPSSNKLYCTAKDFTPHYDYYKGTLDLSTIFDLSPITPKFLL